MYGNQMSYDQQMPMGYNVYGNNPGNQDFLQYNHETNINSTNSNNMAAMNNMNMAISMPNIGINKQTLNPSMIKKQKGGGGYNPTNPTKCNNTNNTNDNVPCTNPPPQQPSKQRKKSQMVFQKDSKDYEID